MAHAPVNRILPYSAVDGPGARVAIFLQGCNFRCAYCHNPETQCLCDGCGACADLCPSGALAREEGRVAWDEARCAACDTCIKACPHNASPRVKLMSAAEVYAKARESLPFVRGLTVSGGECTLYPEFLRELFALAREDSLGCLVDSNGAIDLAPHRSLLDLCDGVMLDVKSWDGEVHRALTGRDNSIVKRNLSFLAGQGKLAELRIVCLEDEVDAEAVLEGVAGALGREAIGTLPLKLIRFRPFGVRGRLSGASSPGGEYMDALVDLASSLGFGRVSVT
jgi:pyruvate formate lyase activating enzyme